MTLMFRIAGVRDDYPRDDTTETAEPPFQPTTTLKTPTQKGTAPCAA